MITMYKKPVEVKIYKISDYEIDTLQYNFPDELLDNVQEIKIANNYRKSGITSYIEFYVGYRNSFTVNSFGYICVDKQHGVYPLTKEEVEKYYEEIQKEENDE